MQPNIYFQLKQLPQQAASTVLSQLRELLYKTLVPNDQPASVAI